MKADSLTFSKENEMVYEELVTVIEASQGTLVLLIAVCDDLKLRDCIIGRYEQELQPDFKPYRLQLATVEPSLRGALSTWVGQQVEPSPSAVLTVTGAESLQWINLHDKDSDRTEIQKFFGYLQWGREGLREFPYPIVLWVTQRILKELNLKAPDFWSWRKGVFRFVPDPDIADFSIPDDEKFIPKDVNIEAFLPPGLPADSFPLSLEDLQELITAIEQKEGTEAPLLGTLYSRLAQVYQRRIEQGEAENLQEERDLAIANYQKAIALQTKQNNDFALINTLLDLAWFQFSQSNFKEAISLSQQSLHISRKIGDRQGEAHSLSNLGNAAYSLEQYQQAITHHEQSLQIQHEIGDRKAEATSLNNLGNAAYFLGQYQQAISYYEQSLQIQREIGDRKGEANSLIGLGAAAYLLSQYVQARAYHEESLQIQREIGNHNGEAIVPMTSQGSSHFPV
jgi:tetratricopeptide (TPR) repeat protein